MASEILTILDSNLLYPIVGFLFTILLLIIFLIKKKRRHQRILLTGCTNSGKTVLFTYLIYDKIVETYTSMKENVGLYKSIQCSIELIDIPGHDRLRQNLIDQYKSDVRGIIFMVDSKSIQIEVRNVAELLYTLLTDPIFRSNCVEILVVCNKQDLPESKGPAVIQLLLEKELNILRSLKTKQLDSTTNDSTSKKKGPFLGSRKKDFEFAHVKPISVSFVESTIPVGRKGEVNVDGGDRKSVV